LKWGGQYLVAEVPELKGHKDGDTQEEALKEVNFKLKNG